MISQFNSIFYFYKAIGFKCAKYNRYYIWLLLTQVLTYELQSAVYCLKITTFSVHSKIHGGTYLNGLKGDQLKQRGGLIIGESLT